MERFKNVVDFFIIFTYEADIKANTLDVAVYDVTKLICISCRLNYGIILILSISPKRAGDLMISIISCLSASRKAEGDV